MVCELSMTPQPKGSLKQQKNGYGVWSILSMAGAVLPSSILLYG